METEINCNEEKKLFFSYMWTFAFGILFLLLTWWLYYDNELDKKNIVEVFKNNQELICNNTIASKELGYKFDKKRTHQITNGVNIFTIYKCQIK
ncbi:hypothetical protein [Arcobacter porcinus]|uniref:Uncharacterized protein n=1 Tax=Arcobacter porcinus TaxID=1935204 RepID=A0A5C2HBY0_9BACT|nr:hypothetical protein [Arcobacter porcinus]OCL89425.1 hypothetical protein AAX27_01956 [Aliarcobacter thereius]QEP40436.1 hypothetical protein APORC_0827 [Arcobacter porcinus]